MKKLLPTLLLIFCTSVAFTQSITTQYPTGMGSEICVGRKIDVPFTTNANFNANNKFIVQLVYGIYEGSNFVTKTLDLETQSTKSPLSITIPDTIRSFGSFRLKVVSSSPAIEGSILQNYIYLRQKAYAVFGGTALTNPYEYATIAGKITGYTPAKIYFDDSTVISLPSYTSDFKLAKFPEKTTSYTILRTENECGIVYPSKPQTATFEVNPIGFKLIRTNTMSPCENGKVIITYESTKAFNANNTFYVMLPYYDLSNKYNTIRIDCKVINNNTLYFEIPKSLTENYNNPQSYDLYATSPAERAIGKGNIIWQYNINSAKDIKINKTKYEVNWNEDVEITIERNSNMLFSGEMVLFDGNQYYKPYSQYSSSTIFKFKPQKTTSFQLIARLPQCDNLKTVLANIEVVVNNGIKIKDVQTTVCEGSKVQVAFQKYKPFDASNVYSMELVYSDDVQKKISIPTTLLNDSTLEFSLGINYFKSATWKYGYGQNATLRLRSSSPFSVSQDITLSIEAAPTFAITSSTTYRLSSGNSLSFSANIVGSNNYRILVNDGTKDFTINNLTFFPSQSTNYTFKQITNNCGTSNIPNSKISVTVDKPIAQTIQLQYFIGQTERICAGKTIAIPFVVNGTTDPNDTYNLEIEVIENNQWVWKTAGTSQTSPINFTIPSTNKALAISYRITNITKKISSNSAFINTSYLPITQIPVQNAVELLRGEPANVWFKAKGGGNIVVELNNGATRTFYSNYDDNSYTIENIINKSETFSVKTVKNECGVGTPDGNVSFTLKDFRIITSNLSSSTHCEGQAIGLMKLIQGYLPSDAKFKVQMSDVEGKNFGDIESYTLGNDIYGVIPAGSGDNNGRRKFRIVCTNYDGFYQSTDFLSINQKATAKLTTENGESALSQVDKTARLKLTFTGSPAYNLSLNPPISLEDNSNTDLYYYGYLTSSQTYSFTVRPKSKGESYQITHLSNTCGYGTYSGKVDILSIKPSLSITATSTKNAYCVGDEIEVNYTSSGDYDANNAFKFGFTSGISGLIEVYQTTKSEGKLKLKIPTTLKTGSYQLLLSSTAPSVSAFVNLYFTITQTPKVTLSGNATILEGTRANVNIQEAQNMSFNYKLSDNLTGQFVYSPENRTFLQINPTKSGEYKLLSVSNACGEGTATGSATIEVIPASSNYTVIQSIGISNATNYCTGSKINVAFTSKGIFSSSNKFNLQLSDENVNNFKTIATGTSPIIAEIPQNINSGYNYRFRVLATDPNVNAATSSFMYQLNKGTTAQLNTNSLALLPNQTSTVKITLNGGSTTRYVYFGTDSLNLRPIYTLTPFDTLITANVAAGSNNQTIYKLFAVYDNNCGYGKIIGNNKLVIDRITASEDKIVGYEVYPNPTSDFITIKNLGNEKKRIILYDLVGKEKLRFDKIPKESQEVILNIKDFTEGTYILSIETSNSKVQYRIIKQ